MIKKWLIVLLCLTAFAAYAQDAQTYTNSLGDNAEEHDYKITLDVWRSGADHDHDAGER